MQTIANELTNVEFLQRQKLNSWATELSAASVSTAAIVVVVGLFSILFFASRVVVHSGSAGYAKANARKITGATVCIILCLAEVYLMIQVTTYIPPGVNKPAYYENLDLKRLDCILSWKGPKIAGSYRDCRHGQGPACTIEEPCTPCNVDDHMTEDVKQRVLDYPGSRGCKICPFDNTTNITGTACNETFQDGIGPYCYYRGFHRVLELKPCSRCCYEVNHTAVHLANVAWQLQEELDRANGI